MYGEIVPRHARDGAAKVPCREKTLTTGSDPEHIPAASRLHLSMCTTNVGLQMGPSSLSAAERQHVPRLSRDAVSATAKKAGAKGGG